MRAAVDLPDAAYELDQAQATYAREADLLDTIHDGTWGQMPELRQTFFDEGRATLSHEWANTPIDAWDRAAGGLGKRGQVGSSISFRERRIPSHLRVYSRRASSPRWRISFRISMKKGRV